MRILRERPNTCIEDEDGGTGERGRVEATLPFGEIPANHGAQDKTHAGCRVEVPHHQGALCFRHQIRQKGPADGERVLE